MRFLKSVARNTIQKLFARIALMKLHGLDTMHHPSANKIANALRDTCKNKLTVDERRYVLQIEAIRKSLASSSTIVPVTDFGAGGANSSRTREEMYSGFAATDRLSNISRASKPYFWGLFFMKLIREFRPTTCIELGTSLGISAAYQASALKLNGNGRIFTLEGSPSLVSIAAKNLDTLGLDNAFVIGGRFHDNLERILREIQQVDYAYIDGHHDEEATISYFETIMPYLSKESIVVFDDISWGEGMRRAWSKILEYENVKISVDFCTLGVCVLNSDIKERHCFRSYII